MKTVKKRNGEIVPLDINKFHKMVEWTCEGLTNVSPSEIELNSSIQFVDGVSTSDIHKITTKSIADLISERAPNYQYVAARSLLMDIRKEVFGRFEPKPLIDIIKKNIELGFYEDLFRFYSEDELNYLDTKINHNKDFNFTYSGLRTLTDKYMIQDRINKKLLESPQQLMMLVSAVLFKNETVDRLKQVVSYYNDLSDFLISLPSPIMSGLRTPVKGYSSCCLIDAGDSKESLTSANSASVIMTTIRAGIGLSVSSIRGIGASVANNTILHNGKVSILKWFESAVKWASQGARGGSATTYTPCWDWEIEKIINLKSNKSTEENSVKKLDYGIGFPSLFFDRVAKNEEWTLFSADDTRDLLKNLYNTELWNKTYVAFEAKKGIRKHKVNARELLKDYAIQYFETGRLYPLFLSNVNANGPFKDSLYMSNLCSEVLLPVKPLKHILDPDGEIALCILSNVNAGRVKSLDQLEALAYKIVRGLDNLIDIQEYPLPAAENSTINGRYLGVGISDWAHYLTRHKVRYNTQEALDLAEEFMEHWQYNLLKASNRLARERGEAPWFRSRSKYADGWLPNDGKWRFISKEDWEQLRADIVKDGLRNLTLSAIPPAGCQTKEGTIQTKEGIKSLEQIMDSRGINHLELEHHGQPCWNNLSHPIKIPTRQGDREVYRVWYNGSVRTRKVYFDDGAEYEFSLNHKLFVNNHWVEVEFLKIGDVVESLRFGSAVVKLEFNINHTYDIEVPEVHEYFLSNGCISHNTSSDVSNSTSGLDMPRDFLTTKSSKYGPIKQIVPNFSKGSSYYTLADEVDNIAYLDMISKFQLYDDQSISTNTWWSTKDFDSEGKFPIGKLIKAIVHAQKIGLKSLYYCNFIEDDTQQSDDGCSGGGCSV